jgi:hypothetical protein
MSERAVLVKFGSKDHISQLRQEGLLYMNNLPYFWDIENKELRGDQFDGVDGILRGDHGTIDLLNGENGPKDIVTNWTMKIHPFDAEKINIFSMYALRPAAGTFPVDEQNFRFGDYALVTTNTQKFINRVDLHLNTHYKNNHYKADLVEYIDNAHIGEVGPFKKLKRFAIQSEWRIVLYDGPGGPRKIYIGSIEDISIIIPSKEINQIIKIEGGKIGSNCL